jgi:hypothetical protein
MENELVKKINEQCPYNQGIFTQPYGIPTDVKTPVVYTRYTIGGYSGGSCWGDEAERFEEDAPKDKWKVLDLVLKEICPTITYLQYKEIEDLIHDNEETQLEYYGNSTDEKIEYIILEELEELLEAFGV